MHNSIYKLEQSTRETKYGRKFVNARVKEEIEKAVHGDLSDMFDNAVASLNVFLDTDGYYQRKADEVNHVNYLIHTDKKFTVEDIVLTILTTVIPRVGAQSIQGVAGILGSMFKFPNVFSGIRVASSMIAVVEYAGFYELILASDSDTGSIMIKSKFELGESVRQYIANTKYQPPMLIPPQIITSNFDAAHYSYSESMILGADNHHDEYINLQNINWANRTPLALDERMLAYEETPKNPEAIDTPTKLENFNRLKVSSRIVYNDLLTNGNKFYVPIKNCKRGREHTQGYHVNIQGSSYKKAIINLHKEEVVTV